MHVAERLESLKQWSLVPLRLMIGFGFAAHGLAKISRGPEKFAEIFTALGVPFPHLTSWVTSLTELIGGLLVMAGAFVVPVSVPLAFVMLTAMFTVHLRYGFSAIKLMSVDATGAKFGPPGYEISQLYDCRSADARARRPESPFAGRVPAFSQALVTKYEPQRTRRRGENTETVSDSPP